MVFNATYNNISVISWRSVLLVEETGGPGENKKIQSYNHKYIHTTQELIIFISEIYFLSDLDNFYYKESIKIQNFL
jgi:hypothetical protein